MPPRPDVPKCTVACTYCRLKKAKCTGSCPCTKCEESGQPCQFPEKPPRTKKRSYNEIILEERLASLEQFLRKDLSGPPPGLVAWAGEPNGVDVQQPSPESLRVRRFETTPIPPPRGSSARLNSGNDGISTIMSVSVMSTADSAPIAFDFEGRSSAREDHPPAESLLPSALPQVANGGSEYFTSPAGTHLDNVASRGQTYSYTGVTEQSVELNRPTTQCAEEEEDYCEHHGKTTFLSICSPRGVEWVCRQLGNTSFCHSARQLATTVTRLLKLSQPFGVERTPDPDYETALRWTTAYFETSVEHTLGLVPRQAFETRLEQHYGQQQQQAKNDLSWYALRNAVFAVGSRLSLCHGRRPFNYAAAQRQSWPHLENALSVLTNLIFLPSDSTAVEAVVLMAVYCEAVSSPCLGYMLLSIAIRLAHSKRFHLHLPSDSKLPESEKATRKWLFWVLYLYDKDIAARSGRPSMIHDEDISLALPTEIRPDTHTDLGMMLATLRHAQISSAIGRELFSTKARARSTDEIKDTVRRLDNELRSWHANLKQEYRLHTTHRPRWFNPRITRLHFLYLQHSFYGSLCTLHSIITQPWRDNQDQQDQTPEHIRQVRESSQIIAEASRSIILDCQQCEINAASHLWLAFYFPILGAINLFINTIAAPSNPSALSDIALIEVIAGIFARLEYISGGQISVTFPREVAEYARELVSVSRDTASGSESLNQQFHSAQPFDGVMESVSFDEFTTFDMTAFDSYEWPSWLLSIS